MYNQFIHYFRKDEKERSVATNKRNWDRFQGLDLQIRGGDSEKSGYKLFKQT